MSTSNPFAGPETGDTPAPPAADGASGADAEATEARKVVAIRARAVPAADLACCRLPLTDLGNAERWRIRYGEDFRFCPEIGWFAWDGRRWALLSEEKDKTPARVMQSVFLTVRAVRNEAALVAATGGLEGYDPPRGSIDALERWADEARRAGRNDYLRACPEAERDGQALWIGGLDEMDFVIDFAKRKSWSVAIAAWAKTSEGSGKLKSVADLAKSFESINIEPTAMDADRMAINVLNGTLRLVPNRVKRPAEEVETGKSAWHTKGFKIKRFAHDRGDLISKLAPVKYLPNAACPQYDAFMASVQPDKHVRRFIHQWGGLSLTGDISEHKLAFFHGGGRNGKGTWVELVAHLAGDYAGTVQFESLADTGTKRRGDQATPDLAKLPGIRMLRISEPSAGVKFDDGLLKQLTGGDPVEARFLNKGFFEFLPSFKITISGNNKPNVRDTSHGFWSRMQLVPWSVTIAEDEIDLQLPAKLREEAAGVLNRLLDGLIDWRENGLIVPDTVRMATHAYRDQSDDLGRFLAQCCLVSDADTDVRVGAKELFEVFEAWAEQGSGTKWSMRGFKKAMEDRAFEQKQSNGMKWLRVALRPGVSVDSVRSGNLPDIPSQADGGSGDGGGQGDDPPGFDPDAPVPGWDA